MSLWQRMQLLVLRCLPKRMRLWISTSDNQSVVLGGLATLVVTLIVAITLVWLLRTEKQETEQVQAANQAPIEIAPINRGLDADNTTVVVKSAPERVSAQAPIAAPVAQGSAVASGFAMDLGAALSFAELSARFARLSSMNGSEVFNRLEPRAVLRDTLTGLEARLLVGPFETLGDAATACQAIRTMDDLPCRAVPFEGELIDRE